MSINQSSAAVLASASAQGISSSPTILTAEPGHGLEIPGGNFLLTADFHRVGGDLLLVGKDGHEVVVRDYFSSHTPPDLISGTGGVIHSDLASRLAGAIAPGQWAEDGAPQAQLHAIGEIQKLSGVVKVHHIDGKVETLQQGATVFQGDVLETAGDGAVGIVFADRSTFSLGKNGRMVMDELVYDPQSHTGHSSMSVVQGTFSFVSGQIAKSAPDAMSVKTPVMTIGIRGTTVAGTAAAEGSQNTIALLSDEDGGVGQIVVANESGVPQILTVPNQALQISSAFQAPPPPVVLPPSILHQIMPDLHNVQETRPAPPSTDPKINSNGNNGNSTGTPPTGQEQKPEGGQPQGQNGEKPEAHNELGNLTPDPPGTPQTPPTDSLLVSVPTPVPPVTAPVPVPAPIPVPVPVPLPIPAPVPAPPVTQAPPVTHTETLSNPNTSVASTIVGDNGNYTLIGGNAESVYTESQQGTDLLAHNNWTILANGNAATVDLRELTGNYSTDGLLGTIHLYANTQASPDSSTPTLSLHNDTHGATIDLNAGTANLAHVHSNGYLKDTVAEGFHNIVGTSGNDRFNYNSYGDTENLSLDGGAGVDTLQITGPHTVNLTGSAMSGIGVINALNMESILGSTGDDLFLMGSSAETISGGQGHSVIDFHTQTTGVLVQLNGYGMGTASGQGIATDRFFNIEIVAGSSGNDTIIGDALFDSLYGGAGNDTLIAGTGSVILDGGLGNDTLIGGTGAATMLGGSGDDLLIAGTANSILDGGAGVDTLDLSAESNYVTIVMNGSGAGTAFVAGGPTDVFYNVEVVIAGDHGGTIIGDNLGDTLLGGTGDDRFISGSGNDLIDGRGSVGDSLDYHSLTSAVSVVLNGTAAGTATGVSIGTDSLYNIENILGGSGNDFLSGGTSSGNVSIWGGAGNDTIRGGLGNDLLMGDGGANTLDYSNSTAGLYVQLGGTAMGTAVGGDIGHDALYNFEILVGGRGNDTLVADGLGDSLYGGSGNDTLIGGGGNDSLYGGAGNDTIVGGVGSDIMDGGAGQDVLTYQTVGDAVSITLTNAALTTGVATDISVGTDSLSNFEVIVGTSYADSIQLLSRDDQRLTGSVTLDGGSGQDTLFADTSSTLSITLSGTTGIMTSGNGGSVSFSNFEKIASGIGADVIQDVNGTAALSGSWFSQNDADAMSAAAVAGTAVKDATGAAQLGLASLQGVNGNAHYLAYLSGGEVYREVWNGSAQTALLMTPQGGSVTNFSLSENGREALYTDGSSLYFYNADDTKAHQVGNSSRYGFSHTVSLANAMSADGHLVAYIDNYMTQMGTYGLVLVNTRTGNVVSETSLGTTAVSQLAFAADGKDVFALNSSGELSSMVLSDDGMVVGGTVLLKTGVSSFQVENDGQGYIYSTSGGVYYSSTRNGVGSLQLTSSTTDAAISGNGRFIAYWNTDGSTSTAVLYDTTTKTKVSLAPVSGDQHSNGLSFSDDGHYLFLSTSGGVISEVNPYFTSSTSDFNTLIGGSHNDTLMGGLDIASGALETVNTATMSVSLNAGNTLIAGSGNQTLMGGGGSDVFKLQSSSLGHVAIIGGGVADNQVLDLSAVTANLFVDLRNTMLDSTAHSLLLKDSLGVTLASDSVSGVSNVIGGAGAASTLVGNQNANTLVAGSGASTTFVGHGGSDQIFFGAHTNLMILTQDYHAETVYLDNVAGAVNLLDADGQVGLNGAARSGNDLILSFNDSGGGGKTVFKDYYVDTNDTLQIVDGGIFVKSGVQEGISLIGAVNATASMYVMTGTSGDDMLIGTTDNMLFLGSASAIMGSDTSKGDDVFLYGRNNVVIGSTGTNDSDSTVYYGTTTAALAGHGITANLSAYYSETVNDGTHSGTASNVNEVFGYNSTDYLVNVGEISGTNNGDTFIGGRYGATANQQTNDVTYRAGQGNNVIVNAGIGSQIVNGDTIGIFSNAGTYYTTTAVMVDYSNSSTGITANLNNVHNWEHVIVNTGASGAIQETVMLTGTVVHDSTHTDSLYGVTDIRGSAHGDVITASSLGSYLRSSLGNDTYIANSGYNTLDYGDATGGLFISLSSTAQTVNWTFADGSYSSFVLQSVGTTAYAMHDYKLGSGFTDVLNLTYGTFNDIRMSYDGGVIIGTGWQDSSGVTMDLRDLGQNGSGAVIDIAGDGTFGTVKGWYGTSSVLFMDVAAIKGTSQSDTFILSGTSNPLSLIGGGGSDTVNLANIGWHTWNGRDHGFIGGDYNYITLTDPGTSVDVTEFLAVSNEISTTSDHTLLLNNVSSESSLGHSATVLLEAGRVHWSDGKWMSINGVSNYLTTLVGATGGDVIVGNISYLSGLALLDGNSSNATLELTDSALSSAVDFTALTNIQNIQAIQLDGTASNSVTLNSAMTKLEMGVTSLTNSTGTFTANAPNATLYLGGGDQSSVLTLGNSEFLNGSASKLVGFSDVAIGAISYHNGTGGTYRPDSVVASLGTAALQDGIHTLDLSGLGGASWVTLSGYSGSSLTVIGGSGIDMFSFDLNASQLATYVLQGDGSDVLNEHSYSYGNSNLEMHATVDINGYAVLYNSPSLKALDGYNAEIVLKGVDLVRFSDHEDLVMGTATRTAALDVALGETITYLLAATGVEGTFTAQATEGTQTVTFDGYTAYLSVGYDPGYDPVNTVTGTGDQLAGTAVLTHAASLVFGSHLNLDLVSATSHDVVDAAGYGFTADGADLRLLALAGASMAMGDSMTLVTNMLNDGGSFAHITGLDSYAARGLALSLDFNATSIELTAHTASFTTSNYLAGSTGTDYILGGHGDQTLSGGGGADEILAVSGNDTVILGDNRFAYADGGSGSSKLSFAFSTASTIDLTGTGQVTSTSTGGQHRADSVEHFDALDLTSSHGSTLVLNESSVYSASNASNAKLLAAGVSASNASHALIIGGTNGDVLDLTHTTTAWTAGSTVNLTVDGASHSYQVYSSNFHGTAESVYVDTHVKVATS